MLCELNRVAYPFHQEQEELATTPYGEHSNQCADGGWRG
jgi:hypothetical protein